MSTLEKFAAEKIALATNEYNRKVEQVNKITEALRTLVDAGVLNEKSTQIYYTVGGIFLNPQTPNEWRKIHSVYGRLVLMFNGEANPSANTIKVYLKPENGPDVVTITYTRTLRPTDKCRYETQTIPAVPEKQQPVLICPR